MRLNLGALIAMVAVTGNMVHTDERKPRVVFNDDAQMLMEAPAKGTTSKAFEAQLHGIGLKTQNEAAELN